MANSPHQSLTRINLEDDTFRYRTSDVSFSNKAIQGSEFRYSDYEYAPPDDAERSSINIVFHNAEVRFSAASDRLVAAREGSIHSNKRLSHKPGEKLTSWIEDEEEVDDRESEYDATKSTQISQLNRTPTNMNSQDKKVMDRNNLMHISPTAVTSRIALRSQSVDVSSANVTGNAELTHIYPDKKEAQRRYPQALLSGALAKANNAVLEDNAQKLPDSIGEYTEAISLLQQVVPVTEDKVFRRNLSMIYQTNTTRIGELRETLETEEDDDWYLWDDSEQAYRVSSLRAPLSTDIKLLYPGAFFQSTPATSNLSEMSWTKTENTTQEFMRLALWSNKVDEERWGDYDLCIDYVKMGRHFERRLGRTDIPSRIFRSLRTLNTNPVIILRLSEALSGRR